MKHLSILTLSASLLIVTSVSAQVTTGSNNSGPGTQYDGWNGGAGITSKDLDLQNKFPNQNIVFYTNPNSSGTTVTSKMTIIGSIDSTDGNVGIGTISTPRTFKRVA